jgi:hypothetical protein
LLAIENSSADQVAELLGKPANELADACTAFRILASEIGQDACLSLLEQYRQRHVPLADRRHRSPQSTGPPGRAKMTRRRF